MFCSRSGNIKINKLHERALRIVYDDYKSTFEELLTKYDSLTTSPKHSELEIEMLKIHYGFSQVSFLGLFHTIMKITLIVYDLNPTFKFQELAVRYFGPVIWNSMKKEVLKILTHLKQKSENGKDLGFYKY